MCLCVNINLCFLYEGSGPPVQNYCLYFCKTQKVGAKVTVGQCFIRISKVIQYYFDELIETPPSCSRTRNVFIGEINY